MYITVSYHKQGKVNLCILDTSLLLYRSAGIQDRSIKVQGWAKQQNSREVLTPGRTELQHLSSVELCIQRKMYLENKSWDSAKSFFPCSFCYPFTATTQVEIVTYKD